MFPVQFGEGFRRKLLQLDFHKPKARLFVPVDDSPAQAPFHCGWFDQHQRVIKLH
jgi:hypothetical protein